MKPIITGSGDWDCLMTDLDEAVWLLTRAMGIRTLGGDHPAVNDSWEKWQDDTRAFLRIQFEEFISREPASGHS